MTFTIERATPADADAIAPLFDAYRQFHDCAADLDLARSFIGERLERSESTIFVARRSARIVGFAQLYASFTSTGAGRVFILNDLYVAPEAEGQGMATGLMKAAEAFARSQGALSLRLAAKVDNHRARALYERTGWKRNEAYVTYDLPLPTSAG
jgi:ribosomal protein S18 acetylase RimI-like enzyme